MSKQTLKYLTNIINYRYGSAGKIQITAHTFFFDSEKNKYFFVGFIVYQKKYSKCMKKYAYHFLIANSNNLNQAHIYDCCDFWTDYLETNMQTFTNHWDKLFELMPKNLAQIAVSINPHDCSTFHYNRSIVVWLTNFTKKIVKLTNQQQKIYCFENGLI